MTAELVHKNLAEITVWVCALAFVHLVHFDWRHGQQHVAFAHRMFVLFAFTELVRSENVKELSQHGDRLAAMLHHYDAAHATLQRAERAIWFVTLCVGVRIVVLGGRVWQWWG